VSEGAERVGIVLTGAAARGAFQAGALAQLLPALARRGMTPTVAIGTSAGAINAALWASYAHLSTDEIGRRLRGLWVGTDSDDIFRHPLLTLPSVTWDALRSSVGLGGGVDALLDTSRLVATAGEALDTVQISANVDHGIVDAVGVVATRMPAAADPAAVSSGRSVLFLDTTLDASTVADPSRALDVARSRISAEHVVASSAIPLAFPAVRVSHPPGVGGWYADGGIRLNAPLRPAVQLGVDRLVVVAAHATRYGDAPGPEPAKASQPDLADSAAHVLHAVLADRMVEDLADLRWTNSLCSAMGDGELVDRCGEPLRRIPVLTVAPEPGQLAAVADSVLRDKYGTWPWRWFDDSGTWLLGRLLRSVGDGPGRAELLSYLAFESEYFAEQITLGSAAADAALARGWSDDGRVGAGS
jgi:NTE family protein